MECNHIARLARISHRCEKKFIEQEKMRWEEEEMLCWQQKEEQDKNKILKMHQFEECEQ